MEFKDHFSKQAARYAKYRPRYPQDLFGYLSELVQIRECVWDCATGAGQAAVGLSPFFHQIIASDASESQIRRARAHPKITYRVCLAEDSGIESDSVDLITVAQAIHWFDFDRFFREALRVLKPEGILAFWGYSLLKINGEIDAVIDDFYSRRLAGYWPEERNYIDEHYASIPFPFREIDPPKFEMTCRWNLDHLLGYLRPWSAVARFCSATNVDPVEALEPTLFSCWGDRGDFKKVVWPLFLRVGKLG